LTELGVDKRLIKNKKILSDLLEKEKEYQGNDDSENNEEQSTDSEEDEKTASEKSQSQETENSDPEAESEIEDSESESTAFIHKNDRNPCQQSSNVYRTVLVKSPKCFWHDNREICPVCSHSIPIDRKHGKEELKRCFDCGAVTYYNRKKSKETFYSPDGDETQDDEVCTNDFAVYWNC